MKEYVQYINGIIISVIIGVLGGAAALVRRSRTSSAPCTLPIVAGELLVSGFAAVMMHFLIIDSVPENVRIMTCGMSGMVADRVLAKLTELIERMLGGGK